MHIVKEALKAIANGKFVIVVDDEDRENEGDLIIASEKVTEESMAFLIRYSTGIVCISMKSDRLEELRLPQMVPENTEIYKTAFTISVDCCHDTTTGVSASDRMKTIHALVDPNTKPSDLRRPGHIFPLRYREGGVLKRAGHTEAAVDLAEMAGLYPSGVISEVVNDNGSMMRLPDLLEFGKKHSIPVISVADIIRYRRKMEKLVERVSQARIPTKHGDFNAYVYRSKLDGIEHMALIKGDIEGQGNVMVRVHSECLTGDVFGSNRCDCGNQLDAAMEKIAAEGRGVIVYLRGHEGRGIGLGHKLRAYTLQDEGLDTVEANEKLGFPVDSREYGIGAQILTDLNLSTIRLMTNNPAKYGGLEGYDIEIVDRIPVETQVHCENKHYLQTKKDKLGHMLDMEEVKI